MLLLKKKRYQEQLLDRTENQISNLERMVSEDSGLGAVGSGSPCPGVGVPSASMGSHFILSSPTGALVLCPKGKYP